MAFLIVVGIFVLTVALLLTILLLVLYSGVFYSVEIKAGRPQVGNICIAYKFRKGPYKDCGELFTEAVKFAPDQRSIGVYYDDPNEVASNELRYIVGCILAEGDETPDSDLVNKLKSKGFGIAKFPKIDHCVNTSFPHVSFMSIYLAVYRVYPKLRDYVKTQKLCAYPFIEIYDKETIYFMGPLAKQNEFYVPEVKDTPLDESGDELEQTEGASIEKPNLKTDEGAVEGEQGQRSGSERGETPSTRDDMFDSDSSNSDSESPFEELNVADSSSEDKE